MTWLWNSGRGGWRKETRSDVKKTKTRVEIRDDALCIHVLSCATSEHRSAASSATRAVSPSAAVRSRTAARSGPRQADSGRWGACVLWPARAGCGQRAVPCSVGRPRDSAPGTCPEVPARLGSLLQSQLERLSLVSPRQSLAGCCNLIKGTADPPQAPAVCPHSRGGGDRGPPARGGSLRGLLRSLPATGYKFRWLKKSPLWLIKKMTDRHYPGEGSPSPAPLRRRTKPNLVPCGWL